MSKCSSAMVYVNSGVLASINVDSSANLTTWSSSINICKSKPLKFVFRAARIYIFRTIPQEFFLRLGSRVAFVCSVICLFGVCWNNPHTHSICFNSAVVWQLRQLAIIFLWHIDHDPISCVPHMVHDILEWASSWGTDNHGNISDDYIVANLIVLCWCVLRWCTSLAISLRSIPFDAASRSRSKFRVVSLVAYAILCLLVYSFSSLFHTK